MFRCRHQLVSTWALLAAAAGLSVSCTLVSLKPHSSYAFLALAVYASFVTWQHYIGPPLLHFRNCIPGPAARKGQTEPQSHFCFWGSHRCTLLHTQDNWKMMSVRYWLPSLYDGTYPVGCRVELDSSNRFLVTGCDIISSLSLVWKFSTEWTLLS